jgi:uncharacterized protein YmfQ (DUF2313 family)
MSDATDRHVRRSGDDYAEAFAGSLPTGPAWPRDPGSTLMQVVTGLMQLWGDVDAAAADLLEIESDPRFTQEMLPDWEEAFGLPDPCVPRVLTIPERHVALVNRMTTQGGQSIAYFTAVAATLGYTITVREYRPFQFGLSSFGGSRGQFQPPSVRFYWRITITGPRLTRFRFGASSFGRDSFLEIVRAEDLECVLTRWKPARTIVLFDYLGA